jgi:hypothetical protein
MQLLGSFNDTTNNALLQFWGLQNPAIGTLTFQATWTNGGTANGNSVIKTMALSGVLGFNGFTQATGSSASATVIVPTSPNDLVVQLAGVGQTNVNFTSSNFNQLFNINVVSTIHTTGQWATGASGANNGPVSLTSTLASSTAWASIGVNVAHVPCFATSVDQYLEPWSEPVRQKVGLGAHLQQVAAVTILTTPPSTAVAFPTSWEEPPPSLLLLQYQGSTGSLQPIISTEDRWHEPWSEPVRTRTIPVSVGQGQPQTPFVEPVLESKWHQPWTEPVRKKIGLSTQLHPYFFWGTEVPIIPTEASFHQPWSEPVRQKPWFFLHPYQAYTVQPPAVTPVGPATAAVPTSWDGPPPSLLRLQYQTKTDPIGIVAPPSQVTLAPSEFSVPIQYFTPWKTGDNSVNFFAVTSFVAVLPQAWPDTIFRPTFAAYQQQFIAVPASAAVIAVPTSLEGPPPSILNFQYQDLAETVVIPTTTSEDQWHQPWSEPVRTKPALNAALQSTSVGPLQPIVSTEDRWHEPWSEPVRTRPFNTALQSTFTSIVSPLITSEDRFHQPWSEPVRQRPFNTALQPYFFWGTEQPIVSTEDRWHEPWSEPVRIRPALPAGQQQFLTTSLAPIISIGWFAPLSEPVRLKPGLLASLQSTSVGSLQPIVSTEDRWHEPWSEPVRQKPGLRAQFHEFYVKSLAPVVPTVTSWYQWITEPVRFKPGLLTGQYPYGFQVFLNLITTYTAQLRATETNKDQFQGAAYIYNAPVKCFVSIAIRQKPIVYFGIVETKPGSGIFVSITEGLNRPLGPPPPGFIYLTDAQGNYLTDADGNYLLAPV